ncbi:O-antigen ligase family protein [Candidatus Avelusimicrobium gallicola]|uniref:O-antigen ligase-related domain-containing protein n=1 Tax=Candidatus Avelusimicrobium gallicola TaxID=2562704 RepID=A0A1Y4DD12_9BACT|nr:O-antigen ligase family protein [Elusimicrobium sp. An273]OUO57013.1 hypothetical protein B5F75_03975 [Elusimicrobium sp. An273]
MASKKTLSRTKKSARAAQASVAAGGREIPFLHKALVHVTGWLCLLVSISFFTATYDTAQVKLTLLHCGAVVLFALWSALQLAERKNPFTRQNLPFLLPVFAYLAWNIVSFIGAPYKMEAAEEFIRLLMYGAITLLIACQFRRQDVKTVTRYILAAAWISFGYALLQIIDGFFPGADFMPWRGFFTRRVFSTHANPNFFGAFAVFASCLAAAQYLLTRQKKLLALLAAGLLGVFFTESKGAWLAYAAAAACFAGLYTNFFLSGAAKKYVKKINLAALCLLLLALAGAGFYTAKRFQSVSFRTFTWLSAWEMVQDSPVMGTGPGSFKIIYPAYRRPQIFYIENSHNTETQHAENEYLEQWATTGTVGLAVFLWLIGFIFYCAVRNLKQPLPAPSDEPLRERNLYLLGYASAFFGLMVHAGVDISIRFASSGLFFAVFCGVILALCQPEESAAPAGEKASAPAWPWAARLLLCTALVYGGWHTAAQFAQVTRVLQAGSFGEGLLIAVAWAVFLFCLAGTAYVYLRAAFLGKRALPCFVLAASVPFLIFFYGFFQANHYYSLGVSLVSKGNAEGALGYFTKAVRLNPLLTEYRQFRANTFATTLQLTDSFSPDRGDRTAPSNDYERALADFAVVLKRAPNHSMVHQNIGQLYYAMAVRQAQSAGQAVNAAEYARLSQYARQNMEQAKRAFERSIKIDPVNPATYAFLTSIALMERNPEHAQQWIDAYRRGPAGVTEPEFLDKHRKNPQFDALQQQVDLMRASVGKSAHKK